MTMPDSKLRSLLRQSLAGPAGWRSIVVLSLIGGVLAIERLPLADGWRGGLQFLAVFLAIAALVAWVPTHAGRLMAHEARRRRVLGGPAARPGH